MIYYVKYYTEITLKYYVTQHRDEMNGTIFYPVNFTNFYLDYLRETSEFNGLSSINVLTQGE